MPSTVIRFRNCTVYIVLTLYLLSKRHDCYGRARIANHWCTHMSQILIIVSPLMVMLFVASITPGPNNLMLMLAGTRFGFAQTVPHLLGVTGGTVLVICITCAGLGSLMLGHPRVVDCMTAACALYLLWVATQLLGLGARAAGHGNPPARARPMRRAQAR